MLTIVKFVEMNGSRIRMISEDGGVIWINTNVTPLAR